jgi:hypothetical protein
MSLNVPPYPEGGDVEINNALREKKVDGVVRTLIDWPGEVCCREAVENVRR